MTDVATFIKPSNIPPSWTIFPLYKPKTVEGITFRAYRSGIMQSSLVSDDGRIIVARNYNKTTYRASIDRQSIGDRFKHEHTAIAAAIKALKAK